METTPPVSGAHISFLGVLTLIFITLKLTGVINWSWWLVLLPFYGPIALAIAVCLFLGLIFLVLK